MGAFTLLQIESVVKSFPGVTALSHVSLAIKRGEVHALVGENGAGKSTLARILSGLERPDEGKLTLNGRTYSPSGKIQAENAGIRTVTQELNLIPTLSIAENIFLNRLPSSLGVINKRLLHARAGSVMEKVGLAGINPETKVAKLGVGQKQMVEIGAALSGPCELLILDEPTSSLTGKETEILFEQIRRLKAEGISILYISHRLEEIKRIADRLTVLRDGRVMGTEPTDTIPLDSIVRMMVGRELEELNRETAAEKRGVALKVKGLTGEKTPRNVSFELSFGEILGFAGLVGAGRTETMRLIFGADKPSSGEIYLYGSKVPERIHSPKNAVRRGIAFLTEDRKQQGLLPRLAVAENITLPQLKSVSALGCINSARERKAAAFQAGRLSLRCSSVDQPVETLSGGNQQKVVMAKWLFRDAEILIFDEPTRGIDVGAKVEIYNLLVQLAAEGKAVIVVSSDMVELFKICDRIAVMSGGVLSGVFNRGEWSQEKIMAAALSELS